jgi:hypothetical protein
MAHLSKLEHDGRVVQLEGGKPVSLVPKDFTPAKAMPDSDDMPTAREINAMLVDGQRRFAIVG